MPIKIRTKRLPNLSTRLNIIYGLEEILEGDSLSLLFQEIYKEDKEGQAELQISVNHTNDIVTALLKQGDKEIRLPKTKVNTFKSRLK